MGKSAKKGSIARGSKTADLKKSAAKADVRKSATKAATIRVAEVSKATKVKAAKSKPVAKKRRKIAASVAGTESRVMPPLAVGASAAVLDRLWGVVMSRRNANPTVSHSARLLSRGTAKIAQKFGEEAVECLIEAVGGTTEALVAESADVLYHLLVMWVNAGIRPEEVWNELQRREGVSGIAEKASRIRGLPARYGLHTTKIP
jgi:phosphoribosyl-ATP pyrophosphohydrolase